MVLSMTGYGRAGALLHGRDIKVELRSVNARFFEYSSRLPRSCAFLEDKLKKLAASKVSRGKVELSLSIQTVTAADTVVTVNWQLAEGYRAALNAMAERMDLKNDVSVGMLSRFPDVLTRLPPRRMRTSCGRRQDSGRAGRGRLCRNACRRRREDEGRCCRPSDHD